MKKILSLSVSIFLLLGCSMNPNKEERIHKLEIELQRSLEKIKELENKIELKQPINKIKKENDMNLGAFSMSLSVKNINSSREFYEKFGFVKIGGDLEKNYLIMKNEKSVIGLFQGMFKGNILTFNPGWDENGNDTDSFIDIRKIQQNLKINGINIGTEIEKGTSGPASFMTTDPDGNVILIDQHR